MFPTSDSTGRLEAALAGRYRVLRRVGEGGMAVVYLAEDVRHHRQVALKVLRPELAATLGTERFLREIEIAARLTHPNILPLLDSGDADGALFYVMPYVEGESLRGRLAREGQLPVEEAVQLTRRVALALGHAHSLGVVHRDIKPENILLAGSEPVVADFGIAKAVTESGGTTLTETGFVVGTAPYMSPEQAAGERQLDGRSDIYALGCVLYEMLAGAPPFSGPTAQAITARKLTEPVPPLRHVRDTVPAGLERVVFRALAKLPADRYATAGQLAEALDVVPISATTSVIRSATPGSWIRALPWVVAASALVAGMFPFVRQRRERPAFPVKVVIASIQPSPSVPGGDRNIAISRDGRRIVYSSEVEGTRQLFLRSLDQVVAMPIVGTEGGRQPSISPDGQSVAFASADGTLKRVPIEGGMPVTLARSTWPNDLTWLPDGKIVFGMPAFSHEVRGLSLVSPGVDTTVRQLTHPREREMHHEPLALPDGNTVLFTLIPDQGERRIGAVTVSTGEVVSFELPAKAPVGVVDGALLYISTDGVLMAVPFDTRHRRVTGTPVRVSEDLVGVVAAVLADDGTLVVVRQPNDNELVLVDMRGNARSLLREAGRAVDQPRVSPDGRRVLMSSQFRGRRDLIIYDVAQGTSSLLRSFSFWSHPCYEWKPDGASVFFSLISRPTVWLQPIDGTDSAVTLVDLSGTGIHDVVMSPDQRSLVLTTGTGPGTFDVRTTSIAGGAAVRPFAATAANELMPRFSSDGRWLAYVSDESGRSQVYARPFPGPGGRVQISDDGGTEPVWSRDGRRIYYRSQRRLMAALVRHGGGGTGLTVTGREMLFEGNYESVSAYDFTNYDVMPDDQHFVMLRVAGTVPTEILMWMNWVPELRAKIAASRR